MARCVSFPSSAPNARRQSLPFRADEGRGRPSFDESSFRILDAREDSFSCAMAEDIVRKPQTRMIVREKGSTPVHATRRLFSQIASRGFQGPQWRDDTLRMHHFSSMWLTIRSGPGNPFVSRWQTSKRLQLSAVSAPLASETPSLWFLLHMYMRIG